jgi:hypothetical protein
VERNQALVEAFAARKTLELQLSQADREVADLTRDYHGWVQAEADRKLLKGDVDRLEEKKALVDVELKSVRAGAERKAFQAKFEKIEEAQARFTEKQNALAGLPVIKPDELKKLQQASAALSQARAGINAGKLKLQFTAKSKMEVSIQKNFDAPRSGTIEAGATMSVQSGGRIQINNELFDLLVVSGEGAVQDAEKKLQEETDKLQLMLQALQAESLEEAQEKGERWAAAAAAARESEGVYKALLGRDDHAALKKRFSDESSTSAGRDPETVEKEFRDVTAQYSEKKSALGAAMKLIQEVSQRHSAAEPALLTRAMLKASAAAEKIREQLAALPSAASGAGDAENISAQFRRFQAQLTPLAEEVRLISNGVVELKARMPEQSAQEFDRQYREAEAHFEAELRRARALLRVQEATLEIEAKAGDVYEEFRAGFERYVNVLSGGKYSKARMKGSLPQDFVRRDGAQVPFEWLSAGTKDAFALALRLSMAKHFLKGQDGFLMMDDPMVAMDPDRQQATADLLRSFAERTQVVVFTCHPSHAELLGGNCISF